MRTDDGEDVWNGLKIYDTLVVYVLFYVDRHMFMIVGPLSDMIYEYPGDERRRIWTMKFRVRIVIQ